MIKSYVFWVFGYAIIIAIGSIGVHAVLCPGVYCNDSNYIIVYICCVISMICMVGCLFLNKFAPGYQRYEYAKKLFQKRYNKGKENKKLIYPLINSPLFRVILSPLKSRPFPNHKHWIIILFSIGVVIIFIPYIAWTHIDKTNFITIIAGIVSNLANLLRSAMQVFVIDGGLDDFIKDNSILKSLGKTQKIFYNCYASVIFVLAGLCFTFKIINTFAKEFKAYFDYWLMHCYSDIYVMSELNNRSIALAESIFLNYYVSDSPLGKDNRYNTGKIDHAKHVKIVFCDAHVDDNEINSDFLLRAQQMGAIVMKKDIIDIKIKRYCKRNTFYLIGQSEETNISQAMQLYNANKQVSRKKKLTIYIYASRPESEYIIDGMHESK